MKTINKLLIVVDMQNDFITGVLGNDYTKSIVPNVIDKINQYIDGDHFILFTGDSHNDETYLETREGKNFPIKHCIIGTEGRSIIPELFNLKYNIDKLSSLLKHDMFGLPEILTIFPDQNFDEIEIIGVATNTCVISVAISIQNKLQFKNTDIIVDASCCASYDVNLHNKALDVMEGLQIKIINR